MTMRQFRQYAKLRGVTLPRRGYLFVLPSNEAEAKRDVDFIKTIRRELPNLYFTDNKKA